MPLRAGILTVAVLLLAAAPAHAAFEITAFELTPSSTVAGAHADVQIATSFTPYDMAAPPQRPRKLVFHLPPGVAGDPFATLRCKEADYRADACPAASKVGSVAADATAIIALLPVRQTATGDLYNLEPAGAEPARLGAVIRPTGAELTGSKLFVPTTINARATDGGLDSVVVDLPTKVGSFELYTERMAFTLQGRPAGGRGPFMRNPTSCNPATTTVEGTPYGEPATTVSRTSTFTPTDCGALGFEPHIDGRIGENGKTARQARPPVRTVITQAGEQANQSSVVVTLPGILAPDLTQLSRACVPDRVATRTCPESSRVGSVEAATPLLAAPLTGAVHLSSKGPGSLPGLTIQLADPIPLRLEGAVQLTPAGLRTTFTGLPDVPLARFQLDLAGGTTGVFQLGTDLCAAKTPAVSATFAAHSGAGFAETKAMTVAGCTPAPAASAKITRLRTGRPQVRLKVTAAAAAPGLREVRLLFPTALRVKPGRARAGARARTGAGRLPRKAITLTRNGELRLKLPQGTRTTTATLAKGTVRVSGKLRRKQHPRRQRLRVLIRDADGPRPPVELKVRPRRR